MLMKRLVGIARERGLTRLEADILGHNQAMLAVFKASGLPMTLVSTADAIHITMSLRELREVSHRLISSPQPSCRVSPGHRDR